MHKSLTIVLGKEDSLPYSIEAIILGLYSKRKYVLKQYLNF